MELVENDRTEVGGERILLKPRGRIPSVANSTRVRLLKRRSKRTCQPTSSPIVQPCSSATRRARVRAAIRRGCSTSTGPSAARAGGTRVVFPAPGRRRSPRRAPPHLADDAIEVGIDGKRPAHAHCGLQRVCPPSRAQTPTGRTRLSPPLTPTYTICRRRRAKGGRRPEQRARGYRGTATMTGRMWRWPMAAGTAATWSQCWWRSRWRSRSSAARRFSRRRSSPRGAPRSWHRSARTWPSCGATEPPGEIPFRQNSQFFYLTGVTEPGRWRGDRRPGEADDSLPAGARRTARQQHVRSGDGAGRDTAKALGLDAVLPARQLHSDGDALAAEGRAIYTPFAAEVLGSQSQGDPTRLWGPRTGPQRDFLLRRSQIYLPISGARGPGTNDPGCAGCVSGRLCAGLWTCARRRYAPAGQGGWIGAGGLDLAHFGAVPVADLARGH